MDLDLAARVYRIHGLRTICRYTILTNKVDFHTDYCNSSTVAQYRLQSTVVSTPTVLELLFSYGYRAGPEVSVGSRRASLSSLHGRGPMSPAAVSRSSSMLDRVLLHGRAEIGQHNGISAHQRKRCRRQRDGCHMSMSRRTLSVARRWHAARSQYRPLRQLPCSAAAAAAADSSCNTLQLLSPWMDLLRGRLPGCE